MERLISYISIKESTAIKGLLILLIILGHNMIFTYYIQPLRGMEYLYCFHIQAFFILPFLYNHKPLSKDRAKDYFIRLYWPYLLLSIPLFIINSIINNNHCNIYDLILMWLTGNPELIKRCCGIQIFWFMPAMFALSIIKDLYYSSKPLLRIILLTISFIAFIFIYRIVSNRLIDDMNHFLSYTPFGFYICLPYLFLGVITRYIIQSISKYQYNPKSLFLTLFISCTIIYFIFVGVYNINMILRILKVIMPCIFILCIWSFRSSFTYLSIWDKLGSKSYSIYLIHPFIGYILYYIFIKLQLNLSVFWAIISQILIIAVSYYLSVLLYKYPKLRMIILPKGIAEITNLKQEKIRV